MSNSTQLIAGEPLDVLAWGLRDVSYRLEPGGMVRFQRRLNDEAGRAWNRAIERTAADLLGPGGNKTRQQRQGEAFARLLLQVSSRLDDLTSAEQE